MDMITEHNYGVPIPLSHDDHSSHMDDIHTEMEKRLIVFLALPGTLFLTILGHSMISVFQSQNQTQNWPKKLKLPVYNLVLN